MKLGYARVSKIDQKLELQLDALRAAGVERIFTDHASGSNVDRVGLNTLLDHARPNDAVVIWRLDRLARSLKDLIELSAEFDRRDLQLISITENIDTTTTGGRLIFQLFGALAEFERNLLIERTRAGLEAAKAKGRLGGRPPLLTNEKKGILRLKLNSLNATNERPNCHSLARIVGLSERTIRRFIANEKGCMINFIEAK